MDYEIARPSFQSQPHATLKTLPDIFLLRSAVEHAHGDQAQHAHVATCHTWQAWVELKCDKSLWYFLARCPAASNMI